MNGADFNKIDDDLWNDIQDIFEGDRPFEYKNVHQLDFKSKIASGFRFRYQSEIDKKSFSSIKGERNQTPSLKIQASTDLTLMIDLVTDSSTYEKQMLHFNTLYEIPKVQKYNATINDGLCYIQIKKNSSYEIKLDFIGIRKLKLKEAIPRIKELYPEMSEAKAKQFYNDNKETVKLRALLIDDKYVVSSIYSDVIKSQNAKENKEIKIQHISPKTVADTGETLIIVLEKKITSECRTYLDVQNMVSQLLNPIFEDGQTFVFSLPVTNLTSPAMAKIRVQCSDREDSKPIRFLPPQSEIRKRKSPHFESDIPLKKPTNYDSPQQLYPETGNLDNFDNIEFDGPHSMDVEVPTGAMPAPPPDPYISSNDSCKDSGIHSNDKSSNQSDSDSDDYDSSFEGSDDDSDVIEIEGVRRRRIVKVENLEPINFPPTRRPIESYLEPNRTDKVANKIFSEVARIGHDFAFGKAPSDLFARMEKQLPVVFTLQDDVGDTPLNNAILKGNVSQAERILKIVREECSWALDLANTSGHTALILAPACDIPASFISQLLDAGCKLDICDDIGKSAVTYAIEYKNDKALSVLLEYIKRRNMHQLLVRSSKVYYSHLQVAVMNGFVEGVKMLLSLKDCNSKYMVDVNELALMNEDTALHIAVERDVGLDIIKLLLERPDIDINHKKNSVTTVLHTAIKMGLTDVVELLRVNLAEDISDVPDNDEDTIDEMEDDDTLSSPMACDMCPVVEMTSEEGQAASNTVVNLTSKMENMSLKGETRRQLIKLLITGPNGLNVSELSNLIKPSFRTLLSKYTNTNDNNNSEIIDILDRFKCLPNSVGQLCEILRDMKRPDIIQKVADHFKNS